MGLVKAGFTPKQQSTPVRGSEVRSFVATVNADEITDDEKKIRSIRQMHADMKSYRIRREKALEDSMEFAKHYTCKAK